MNLLGKSNEAYKFERDNDDPSVNNRQQYKAVSKTGEYNINDRPIHFLIIR